MTFNDATGRRRTRLGVLFILLLAALAGAGAAYRFWWVRHAPAYAFDTRVAWTASHVVGSPDPADSYVVESAFPSIKCDQPLDIAFMPGGARVFIAERKGRIRSFANDPSAAAIDLALDLNKLPSLEALPNHTTVECNGIAFDPDFANNRFFYVTYHANFPTYNSATEYARLYPQNANATRVSRFVVSGDNPPVLDPAGEQIIITWPAGGHNAGCLKFGPDGMLYIGAGDNGDPDPPDPFSAGQNLGDLRAKIMRIDVKHPSGDKPYSVPADNPFVASPGARGEVFAYGLRNPWRFSFDRQSGQLWAGDVGWELWESVQHVTRGGNYGWSIMEGPQPVHPAAPVGPTPITAPALALPHTEAASLIGGFVYHGNRLAPLQNNFIFGDWQTRRLWAAPVQGDSLGKYITLAQTDLQVVSFAEDDDGELYILDYDHGGIYRLSPNARVGAEQAFPKKLSQTGLFDSVSDQKLSAGVMAFNVNSPQWVDGSSSVRFIAAPTTQPVVENVDGQLDFPANTVLARTLSLPIAVNDTVVRKNIETQMLHFDGKQWHGYSYRWNTDQSDAALVDAGGADAQLLVVDPSAPTTKHTQPWHFNSRAQCMTCHTNWTHYTLAFNPQQLDRNEQYDVGGFGLMPDNQLRAFRHIGLLPEQTTSPDHPAAPAPALVDPYQEDGKLTLDERARSYLAVNCSVCHRFGGGGTALIDLSREKSLDDTKLLSAPMLGSFSLPDARVVSPGHPGRSVLYYRMCKSGAGRMPHLGTTMADPRGLSLIARWIESLPPPQSSPSTSPSVLPASQPSVADAAAQEASLATLRQAAAGDNAVAAIDQLLSTSEGALRLFAAIEEGSVQRAYRSTIGDRALLSTQQTVRDLFTQFAPAVAVPKVGTDPDAAKLLAMPGDAERGRKVFFELGGGLCSKCHVSGEKGNDFGPNLSHIGARYARTDLLDNILHPSKTIAPGFETHLVHTRDGQIYAGFVVSSDADELVLKDQTLQLIHLKKAAIDKEVKQPISAMPEGVLSDLEPQQAADLLEYLVSSK